jgi:hypothetical protein
MDLDALKKTVYAHVMVQSLTVRNQKMEHSTYLETSRHWLINPEQLTVQTTSLVEILFLELERLAIVLVFQILNIFWSRSLPIP